MGCSVVKMISCYILLYGGVRGANPLGSSAWDSRAGRSRARIVCLHGIVLRVICQRLICQPKISRTRNEEDAHVIICEEAPACGLYSTIHVIKSGTD